MRELDIPLIIAFSTSVNLYTNQFCVIAIPLGERPEYQNSLYKL